MIKKKEWKEFQTSGLLWWTNRTLHLFGWAIVFVVNEDGTIADVYPARVKFRGFIQETESNGFESLTKYMSDNAKDLLKEVE